MIEKGVVVDIRGKKVVISTKRTEACGSCNACKADPGAFRELELVNTIGARKGDTLNIEINDHIILKGAFVLYIIPLIGFLLGIFAGKTAAHNLQTDLSTEVICALSGVIGVAVSLIAIKKYTSLYSKCHEPVITRAED